jgi:hypothetical protein
MERNLSRRRALQQLALIAAGVAACTPARVLLQAYPQVFDDDPALADRVLRAFAATAIPAAAPDDPDLARVLTDPDFPFAEYAGFLAADLTRRARARFGAASFEQLAPAERAAVIRDGLTADATSRKLYGAALTLAEIAFYAAIYDPQRGCAPIRFSGAYRPRRPSELTYPDPARFLAPPATPDGNPA